MNRRRQDEEMGPTTKFLKWMAAIVVGGIATGVTTMWLDRKKDREAASQAAASAAPAQRVGGNGPIVINLQNAPTEFTDLLAGKRPDLRPPAQKQPAALPSIPEKSSNDPPVQSKPPADTNPPAGSKPPTDSKPPAKGAATFLATLPAFGYEKGPWELGVGELGDGAKTPIKVGGRASSYGLSMHPPNGGGVCRVHFTIDSQFKQFKGWAALNDHDRDGFNPVHFKVLGDARVLWESGDVTRKGGAVGFNLDVTGVKVLTLETKMTRGLNFGGHAVWFDPWLEK